MRRKRTLSNFSIKGLIMKASVFLLVILFIAVVASANVATPSDFRGGPGDCTPEDLLEDNGSSSSSSNSPNRYWVACLTPDAYPSFLIEAKVNVDNYSSETSPITVFTSSIAGGPPALSAFWQSGNIQFPSGAWYSYDLKGVSEFDVPITSGSWCIGVRTLSGTDWLFVRWDTAVDQGHVWESQYLTSWSNFPENGLLRGVSEWCDECACYIGDVCYAEGDSNPSSPHEICDPATSITAWTYTVCLDEDLIEDNGETMGGLAYTDEYFVTCLQPPAYPSFLSELSGFSRNDSGNTTHYAVFAAPDVNGPPAGITPRWTSEELVLPHEDWHTYDLSGVADFDEPITSGSWCIGINTPGGADIWASRDNDGTQGGGYWRSSTPGSTWSLSDGNGDLMYRGVSEECDDCACYVDGACYYHGDTNPANICEVCDIAVSIDTWSPNDGISCNDGLWCNGGDTCSGGSCSHSGSPCPDDGAWCNGVESCNETSDLCEALSIPDCDDDIACTDDSCNEGTDSCDNIPDHAPCDDGLFCNGTEVCDEFLGCLNGTPPTGCEDDGLWCNGDELCDEGLDECYSTPEPCGEGFLCDEDADTCLEMLLFADGFETGTTGEWSNMSR
ncbi:MAG: hypothetical protein K8R59_17705 [Thermoanaerobaculales bacterium]|nr:hypothetical protein [Thermoanaerobaculales bacterium]